MIMHRDISLPQLALPRTFFFFEIRTYYSMAPYLLFVCVFDRHEVMPI